MRRSDALLAIKALSSTLQGRNPVNLSSLDLSRITPFRRKVYEKTRAIPKGRVSTHGLIVTGLGSKRYSRVVGTMMATNPFVLFVPCHKVVSSTREVGKFGHRSHVKPRLLWQEGIVFKGDKISRADVWNPSKLVQR